MAGLLWGVGKGGVWWVELSTHVPRGGGGGVFSYDQGGDDQTALTGRAQGGAAAMAEWLAFEGCSKHARTLAAPDGLIVAARSAGVAGGCANLDKTSEQCVYL
jgi:hypothetical protein